MPELLDDNRFRGCRWLHEAIGKVLEEDGPQTEMDLVRALEQGGMALGPTHHRETIFTCLNLYIRIGRFARREGKVYLVR